MPQREASPAAPKGSDAKATEAEATASEASGGAAPARLPADLLRVELERLSREADADGRIESWLASGRGRTAFNAYCRSPETDGDAILLGVYFNGRVWSDIKALGPALGARLASAMGSHGIVIRLDQEWTRWRGESEPFEVTAANASAIAEAVAAVIGS